MEGINHATPTKLNRHIEQVNKATAASEIGLRHYQGGVLTGCCRVKGKDNDEREIVDHIKDK